MQSLGNRMKSYENVWHASVPPNSYVILRLDGRAFHTLLARAAKPFDNLVGQAMRVTAKALCERIPGVEFGYVQSDEISILLTDLRSLRAQLWFDGDVQKLTSVSASIATAAFNDFVHPSPEVESIADIDQFAYFDSRILTLPHPVEVANYFVWRQRDAQRNALAAAGQAQFNHLALQGKNSGELRKMLLEYREITFPDDYPPEFVMGRILVRETAWVRETMDHPGVERLVWESYAAPEFYARADNKLAELIPPSPEWKD